ncbi:hypothetical protein [Haloglycomyces albus]|uniref:hypothetical protein n=1 Tax=Haloglycomyces albus TaxID=526067 RepID=UPI00046D2BF5|nr:hypothetical protein [Haloglycomyces albus]
MENNDYFMKTMKAHTLGRTESVELIQGLPNDGDWGLFTLSTFSVLLEKALDDDTSQSAVKQFVERVRYAYRRADPPFNGLILEGLIRGLLGEEAFLDEITPEQQYEAQMLTIRYVAETDEHVKAHIDTYLTDAATLADQWSEETSEGC